METIFLIIKVASFALLGLMVVGIIIVFISAYKEDKKSNEQKHIEKITHLIKLFTNISLKNEDVRLLNYEFIYGLPVKIKYKFQILKPIDESTLLNFDTCKIQNPPGSYDVLISKEGDVQNYVITCLDYDDKQNII